MTIEYIGFGKDATGGGSSPTEHLITSSAMSGEGSLPYILANTSGNRVIRPNSTFWIDGDDDDDITDNTGNITIEAVYNGNRFGIQRTGLRLNASNVIVENLRVFRGDADDSTVGKAQTGDCLHIGPAATNILIDHCHFAWSVDELVTIRGQNITFNWCTLSHALANSIHAEGEHSKGIFSDDTGNNISLLNSIMIHNNDRNPVTNIGDWEIINCLIANCLIGTQVSSNDGLSRVDYIGNVILNGANTNSSSKYFRVNPGVEAALKQYHISTNNIAPSFAAGDVVQTGVGIFKSGEGGEQTNPFNFNGLQPYAASQVLATLKHYCGPEPFNRDTYAATVMGYIPTSTSSDATGAVIDSQTEVGGWPTL